MSSPPNRPVYLNLFAIKLPPAGMASIAHRLSGVLLVLCTPLFIALFARSLQDPAGFQATQAILSTTWFKAILLLLCWAIAHHLLAGIRFLLLDIDIGMHRDVLNKTAWGVIVLGLLCAALLAWRFI